MDVVKKELGENIKQIKIVPFADEHMGDPLSDIERLKMRIKEVEEEPNTYAILNGDLVDNATRHSIGDVYMQEFSPMEQLRKAIELFEPIKHKVLCITQGNHEDRSYKETGLNMNQMIAAELQLEKCFSSEGVLLFIRFGKNDKGRKHCYTIYVTHGRGGGRKEGAKAIRLADMANIVDADVYIHSHTHLPMILKESFFRTCLTNSSVMPVTKLFVNTASNLNYGGYGQVAEFKPNSKDAPAIYLSGTEKSAWAKL